MKKTKISIALATYNGAQYLKEQLDSYLVQTLQPDELVVCDDCSNDDTLDVLEEFKQRAQFPVLIEKNKQNKGTVASFENAVSRCEGQYIFFSDHDDVWLPDKIEAMMIPFEKDKNTGLVFCNAEVVDENLNPIGCHFWESVWFDRKSRDRVLNGLAFSVFLNHIVVAGMSTAFRADLRTIALPMPDLSDGYDGWAALLVAAVSNVKMVDRCLVKYRVHGKNQVGVRILSFKEQFEIGIQQVQNETFPNLLNYRKEIVRRLTDPEIKAMYTVEDSLVEKVRESIRHLEKRINLPESKILKTFPVISEAVRGNYSKYSYGIKSIAQDLFLK
jgi:glycosyltransferase involved in cell wall biosynthesis